MRIDFKVLAYKSLTVNQWVKLFLEGFWGYQVLNSISLSHNATLVSLPKWNSKSAKGNVKSCLTEKFELFFVFTDLTTANNQLLSESSNVVLFWRSWNIYTLSLIVHNAKKACFIPQWPNDAAFQRGRILKSQHWAWVPLTSCRIYTEIREYEQEKNWFWN